jgi:hypothetical protein
VNLLSTLPRDTVIAVEVPFGQNADGFLRAIFESALSRGLNTVGLRDPLQPENLAHVAIPAHSILFTTDVVDSAVDTVPADAVMNLREVAAREKSFDRNAYELLLQRAAEQLKGAKDLHDELEGYYVANMDFLRWEKLLGQVREELKL